MPPTQQAAEKNATPSLEELQTWAAPGVLGPQMFLAR